MGELVEILLGADSYQSYIASQILGLLGFDFTNLILTNSVFILQR